MELNITNTPHKLSRQFIFILFLIFFLSGISGLVYEVVWLRMLLRTFGVTIYAVSTVLTVFMSGLAIGALVVGRKTDGQHNLLRWYAIIEFFIGITAGITTLVMTFFPSWIAALTTQLPNDSATLILIRVIITIIVLFPTTFLMGMTLPLMSGFLGNQHDRIGKLTGLLYSINTFGAVFGVLVTGFIGLYYFGEIGVASIAVAINLTIGLLAFWMSRYPSIDPPNATHSQNAQDNHLDAPQTSPLFNRTLIIVAISGFSALAFQVVWSRLLTVILGNSVYAFSIMLSVYLIGISCGSAAMSPYIDRIKQPLALFASIEFAVVIFAITSLHTLTFIGVTNPGPENISPMLYTYSPIWHVTDFARLGFYAIVIIFPVTFFLGALFPIACKLCATNTDRTEKTVGKVYGYNTVGAIFGSFVSGFILIPFIGTQQTFIFANIISIILVIYIISLSKKFENLTNDKSLIITMSAVAMTLIFFAPQDPFLSIFKQKLALSIAQNHTKIIAHQEDKTATATLVEVSTKHNSNHQNFLYVNGLFVSNTSSGMGTALITHPLAFHPDPKKVLIIGLGVGEAYKTSLRQGFDTTVVELVPPVLEFFKRFDDQAEQYLKNPLSHIVIGDGRNFLLRSEKMFDYVVVDGSPPFFASGMINLYSYDFAQMVAQKLNPGGIFAIWLPDICFADDIWMVTRNFTDTFEHVALFAVKNMGGVILMGSNADNNLFEAPINVLTQRLQKHHIAQPEIHAQHLVKHLLFSAHDIKEISQKYPRATDNYPYTEFPFTSFLRGKKYHKNNDFLIQQSQSFLGSHSIPASKGD